MRCVLNFGGASGGGTENPLAKVGDVNMIKEGWRNGFEGFKGI